MFSLMFLHLFMYGCNMVAWRKARINYSFIFEFAAGRELKYRDVFLVCTASMAVIVGVMFAHLSLAVRGFHAQAIPGFLLLVNSSFLLPPVRLSSVSHCHCQQGTKLRTCFSCSLDGHVDLELFSCNWIVSE